MFWAIGMVRDVFLACILPDNSYPLWVRADRTHNFWILQIRDQYLYGFSRDFVKRGRFRILSACFCFCKSVTNTYMGLAATA